MGTTALLNNHRFGHLRISQAGAITYPVRSFPQMAKSTTPISPRHALLGSLLREAREATGLRQVELARMLGRKQAFVSKYETGVRGLDVIDVLNITKLIECDASSIIAKMTASEV